MCTWKTPELCNIVQTSSFSNPKLLFNVQLRIISFIVRQQCVHAAMHARTQPCNRHAVICLKPCLHSAVRTYKQCVHATKRSSRMHALRVCSPAFEPTVYALCCDVYLQP
jgi:hypothetical protein